MWLGGGAFVEAAYFTSEEAAGGEGETSAEFEGAAQDFAALFGEMTYTDLRGPDPHVRRSMIVTLAWPPPSHIVCRP